eukprot:642415-Pyramimonas_sp.AAC.1
MRPHDGRCRHHEDPGPRHSSGSRQRQQAQQPPRARPRAQPKHRDKHPEQTETCHLDRGFV